MHSTSAAIQVCWSEGAFPQSYMCTTAPVLQPGNVRQWFCVQAWMDVRSLGCSPVPWLLMVPHPAISSLAFFGEMKRKIKFGYTVLLVPVVSGLRWVRAKHGQVISMTAACWLLCRSCWHSCYASAVNRVMLGADTGREHNPLVMQVNTLTLADF